MLNWSADWCGDRRSPTGRAALLSTCGGACPITPSCVALMGTYSGVLQCVTDPSVRFQGDVGADRSRGRSGRHSIGIRHSHPALLKVENCNTHLYVYMRAAQRRQHAAEEGPIALSRCQGEMGTSAPPASLPTSALTSPHPKAQDVAQHRKEVRTPDEKVPPLHARHDRRQELADRTEGSHERAHCARPPA